METHSAAEEDKTHKEIKRTICCVCCEGTKLSKRRLWSVVGRGLGGAEEKVGCRVGPSGGLNIRESQILLCEDSSEITFELLGLKRGFIFTPLYYTDGSSRDDCRGFMFCNVDRRLELEGVKFTLFPEQ